LAEAEMIFKLTNIPPRSQGKSSKQLFYDLCLKAFPNLSSPAPNKFKMNPKPRNCYIKHSGPGQKPTFFTSVIVTEKTNNSIAQLNGRGHIYI
jgi:hypothetical protein